MTFFSAKDLILPVRGRAFAAAPWLGVLLLLCCQGRLHAAAVETSDASTACGVEGNSFEGDVPASPVAPMATIPSSPPPGPALRVPDMTWVETSPR